MPYRSTDRRPPSRRGPAVLAVLTAALAVVALAACGADDAPGEPTPAQAAEPAVLRLGPLTTQNTLTLAAAEAGPLAEALTEVDGRFEVSGTFPAFSPAAEALAAGQVDLTTGSSTAFVAALGANPDMVVLAVEHNDDDTQGIVAGPGTGITSVGDLAGRRVAINEGGTGDYLLRLALEREGMTIDDVEPVLLGPADAAPAFAAGSVDAWATWDQYLAFAQGTDGARTVALARDIGAANRTVHVVSRAVLDRSPALVRAAYDALEEQSVLVRDDPSLLADAYQAAGAEPEVAERVAARTPPTVRPADDAFRAELQEVADFYADQGLVPARVDVTDAVVDVSTLP